MDADLSSLFSVRGLAYGLIIPLIIVGLLALMLIPSLLRPGAKVRGVAEAIYCYFMLGFGVLLMTLGALPTIQSVFAGMAYSGQTYLGLLVVFAIGGAVFLWHDQYSQSLDSASKVVPATIYFYLFKIIGFLLTLLAALSLMLSIILGGAVIPKWWVAPLVVLLYGLLLIWCTRSEETKSTFFSNTLIASRPKKKVARKKRRK